MKNYKGKYLLVDNFFDDKNRSLLPVNLYLLRVETEIDISFDSRFFANSDSHKNEKRLVGKFYKEISQII